ncbi:MAG: hypothetical protein AAF975_06525, partial [Spirochaetota bacterium]
MPVNQSQYDESKIQTLEALEHIRLRSGMYIGRLGSGGQYEDGIYILLKEIIDNSIDEYIMGNGKNIEIFLEQYYDDGSRLKLPSAPNSEELSPKIEAEESPIQEAPPRPEQDGDSENFSHSEGEEKGAGVRKITNGKVAVRDYGRGIPLGKIVEAVSVINTGAKYNDDVFQFSVGLNGVGTKAVNALSEHFLVRSYRGGRMAEAVFAKGKLQSQRQGASDAADGTYVEFWPDREIFGDFAFQLEFLQNRIFHYSCLNPDLQLFLEVGGKRESYRSKNGLQDLLRRELPDGALGTLYEIVRCEEAPGDETGGVFGGLEFAFTHTQQIGETHFSFVNGQFTVDGGIHLQAFREGFTRGI